MTSTAGSTETLEASAPLLRAEHLTKHFPTYSGIFHRRSGVIHAVDGVSLGIEAGRTLALVGESGCGKSTTARMIAGLIQPTEGKITLDGEELAGLSRRARRERRQDVQIVFQDPFASLNPRMKASEIAAEPLRAFNRYKKSTVDELFDMVQLSREFESRRPTELSGGQRQRLSIARSLALHPKVLLLDEPTSALDVSIQAQILALLRSLQAELSMTCLLITHDLSVVAQIAHTVAVMYLGKIVETGPVEQVFRSPRHPYTQALLAAVPVPDPTRRGVRRIVLSGDPPSPAAPPSGCRFRTRCWKAQDICASVEPPLGSGNGSERVVACHFPDQPTAQTGTGGPGSSS